MKKSVKILLMTAVLPAVSCTVKESREGGPCWLYETSLRMPQCSYVVSRNGVILHEAAITAAGDYEFDVPRGDVRVVAVKETPHMSFTPEKTTFVIENGVPIDSIYTYRREVDCSGEYAVDTLIPRKQFATFHISFDMPSGHGLYPDLLILKSQWCGENVLTLEPVAGEYECCYPCDGDADLSFRVPRQGDNSLSIVLYRKSDGEADIVPVGEILGEKKYDWASEELEDVDMTMTQAGMELKIVIADWKDMEKPIVTDL